MTGQGTEQKNQTFIDQGLTSRAGATQVKGSRLTRQAERQPGKTETGRQADYWGEQTEHMLQNTRQ